MTEKLLDIIAEKYPLTELEVRDDIKASGMKFDIRSYNAEGLGHVSVMSARGFFGLMRMDTLIVNPKNVDLPLYSYDRIYAMGNDVLIVELYDTLADPASFCMDDVKQSYSDVSDRDPGEHWYDGIKLSVSISKKGKKKDTPRLDELTLEHFLTYLGAAVSTDNAALKKKKADVYVEGLLSKGGPSTDAFKKAIGEEKTAELFRTVLFGTNR